MSVLVVAVGDIHGRFVRTREWLAQLAGALSRPIDLALAVGDLEAFVDERHHAKFGSRPQMQLELLAVARDGGFSPALHFIGGNNEDFAALHAHSGGHVFAGGLHYLGRSGERELAGLRVAYLSGIFAPRSFESPRAVPKDEKTAKQEGYFRAGEIEGLMQLEAQPELLIVHEWPRGLAGSTAWHGNMKTRAVVKALRPKWVLCGHSHHRHAATMRIEGSTTRVMCLDQATRPDDAVGWMVWEGGEVVEAGWGVGGEVAFRRGDVWGVR